LKKKGFTIAEFLITATITMFAAMLIIPIVFKKNTASSINAKGSFGGTYTLECISLSTSDYSSFCKALVSNSGVELPGKYMKNADFITVHLIGAGGKSASGSYGKPGEIKEILYPSFKNGCYKAIIGNSTSKDTSLLYSEKCNGTWETLEIAQGGLDDTYSNNYPSDSDTANALKNYNNNAHSLGICNSNESNGNCTGVGDGGYNGGNGQIGGIYFTW